MWIHLFSTTLIPVFITPCLDHQLSPINTWISNPSLEFSIILVLCQKACNASLYMKIHNKLLNLTFKKPTSQPVRYECLIQKSNWTTIFCYIRFLCTYWILCLLLLCCSYYTPFSFQNWFYYFKVHSKGDHLHLEITAPSSECTGCWHMTILITDSEF